MAKTLFGDLMVVNDPSVNTGGGFNFEEGFSFQGDQNDGDDSGDDDDNDDDPLKKPATPDANAGEGGDADADDNDEGDEGDSDDDDEGQITAAQREIKAFHDIIVEKGIMPAIENFNGDEEVLSEHLDRLPETYFLQAVNEEVPGSYQDLVKYIFVNGENASFDQIRNFFNEVVNPLQELQQVDISDEDKAYEYLQRRLKGSLIFKTEEKLTAYLDSLVVDKSLLSIAEEHYQDEVKALEERSKGEIAAAEQAKQERLAKSKEFGTKLLKELDTLPWAPALKTKAIETLKPGVMQDLYNQVFQNPSALLHLSAFLTHFNPTSGVFDLSSFAKQVSSAQIQKEKEKIEKGSISSHLKTSNGKPGRSLLSTLKPIN